MSMSDQPPGLPHTDDEWQSRLSPAQYRILRCHGTEHPGTSPLNYEKRTGYYLCAGCGQALFTSAAKFDSGTGWPSFFAPIDETAVATTEDRTLGMTRIEVHCSRCGGHLGHVFDDGPLPTGQRYCTNGMSLQFQPVEDSGE